jgi:GH43 family beta-xylosidase
MQVWKPAVQQRGTAVAFSLGQCQHAPIIAYICKMNLIFMRACLRCWFLLVCCQLVVNGVAGLPAGCFQNPIGNGADPWMVYFDGNYYLSTTQGDAIRMWKAPTLAALKTTAAVTVWKDGNPERSSLMWAPEFHWLEGHWWMYYTATSSNRVDARHRTYVLESAGRDPLGPYDYKAHIYSPTNDHYAIDPTVFQNRADGALYFLWAADPGHVLYIARMANPYQLEGNGVYLPADGFGCANVREGPEILQHGGKIFLIYSICDTGTPDYKLGMLIADEKANLLNPGSWKQYPEPVFERNDANGVFGPGHCGFFQSPDGTEDWIVYHAKVTARYTYSGRTPRAQKFGWNSDGTPNFGVPQPLSAVIKEPSGTP